MKNLDEENTDIENWINIISGNNTKKITTEIQKEALWLREAIILHHDKKQNEASWKCFQSTIKKNDTIKYRLKDWLSKLYHPIFGIIVTCLFVFFGVALLMPNLINDIDDEYVIKSLPLIYMTVEVNNPLAYVEKLKKDLLIEGINIKEEIENEEIYLIIQWENNLKDIESVKQMLYIYQIPLIKKRVYGLRITKKK